MKPSGSILVFTPTRRVWERSLRSIFRLAWDGPIHFLFTRDNPYATGEPEGPYRIPGYRDNILHNYVNGRKAFLAGDYDAMLTVEADMIVPEDALQKLAAVDADVAYGLYCWRHGRPLWNPYIGETNRSIALDPETARDAWGKVIECRGVGLGCTLIHRHVLEALIFRGGSSTYSCDWYFAIDLLAEEFVQKAHLGVVCGHIADVVAQLTQHPTAELSPRVIWPDVESDDLYRIEYVEGDDHG